MNTILRTLVFTLVTLCLSISVSAATFTVNTTNDTADASPGDGTCADSSSQCSLRAALMEANALAGDDTINVPAGTYTQTLVAANEDANAGGDWDINSNIVIAGAGAATTILQANAAPNTATERVMEVVGAANVVTINGVTLRHGNKTGAVANTTRGGGIRNFGTLTMNNCIVTLNRAVGAGGVRNERTITLNNVEVSSNTCSQTGGSCFGGGMYNTLAANSVITLTNSQFINNTSQTTLAAAFGFAAGFGIESSGGFTLNISGSTFSGNTGIGTTTAGSNGQGLRLLATATSTVTVTDTVVSNNSGTGGASIQGVGIAIFTGAAGTGTFNTSFDRVTVSGNNSSAGSGGGIYVNATTSPITVNLSNSTVSGNSASTTGGGIALTNVTGTATANVTLNSLNNTISGNTATTSGANVSVERPATTSAVTANFNFTTIAGGTAGGSGGGISQSGASVVNIKNSIVGLNAAPTGPDMVGTINSQDYNHFNSVAGATITGTTTNNATGDPQIGLLANNGGPTQTRLPNVGSPVINMIPNGTNDCGSPVNTDQRGDVRPAGGNCDKGSVEVAAGPVGPFDLSGFVRDPGGRPIRNVVVSISGGSLPQPITMVTGMLGQYGVNDLPGGTYNVMVFAKRYTFSPASQSVNLNADISNANFTATEPFGVDPVPEGECNGSDCSHEGHTGSGGRFGVLIGDRLGTVCEDPNCEDGHTGAGNRPGVLIGDRLGTVCEDPNCEDGHTGGGNRPGVLVGDGTVCEDPDCESDHDPATGGRHIRAAKASMSEAESDRSSVRRGGDSDGDDGRQNGRKKRKQ